MPTIQIILEAIDNLTETLKEADKYSDEIKSSVEELNKELGKLDSSGVNNLSDDLSQIEKNADKTSISISELASSLQNIEESESVDGLDGFEDLQPIFDGLNESTREWLVYKESEWKKDYKSN